MDKQDAAGLSEMDSDKPRRGRRPVLPAELTTILQDMEPQLTSRRSLLNRHYMMRALKLLDNADPGGIRYRWLIGRDAPMGTSSRRGGVRMVLVTELGRIEDPVLLC